MSVFVDVSHTIEDGLVTYKGLPAPLICDFLSREESQRFYSAGTEFQIGKIEMVANTGTYIDAPFHRYADGLDIAGLPLEKMVNVPGIVIRARKRNGRSLDPSFFTDKALTGKAVLIETGWSDYWNSEQYYEGHPFLTEETALFLKDAGVVLVGIDSYNIDDTEDGRRPVHTILLGNQIPIVEHLTNLKQLPDDTFRFFTAPVKVKGMGSFPVRAYALVP